jgi:hypothetical protein
MTEKGKTSHTFVSPETYNTHAKAKKDMLDALNEASNFVIRVETIGAASRVLNIIDRNNLNTIKVKLIKFRDVIHKKKAR